MQGYDEQYIAILKDIFQNGEKELGEVRATWADGTPAYSYAVVNKTITLDASEQSGRLSAKFVGAKDPIKELLWIWSQQSNVVKDLQDVNCHVWDEWEQEDGTIGKAYGYQLAQEYRFLHVTDEMRKMSKEGKIKKDLSNHKEEFATFNQVDWLICKLSSKDTRESRRLIVTMWNAHDLDKMALEPCVYETHFMVLNNTLHATVKIRGNDMGLGNSYNVYQYTSLLRMLANVTNLNVGTIQFNIDNAHIYDRHIEPLKEMVRKLEGININSPIVDIKNRDSFYDYIADDFSCEDYLYHMKLKLEVAI